MRLTYPTNIKIIRVPCTGKVDVMYLLRCFQEGADGVYCVGCMEGNCHYNQGNLRCRERVDHIHALLEEIGIVRIWAASVRIACCCAACGERAARSSEPRSAPGSERSPSSRFTRSYSGR